MSTIPTKSESAGFRCMIVGTAMVLAARLNAQPPPPEAPRVGLYDTVAAVLKSRWPDKAKRRFIIVPLIEENRSRADSARTFGEEAEAVQALLRKIPSSHLGLTSATAAHALTAALTGAREPMFGMQLMRWQGRWYATTVLDGGPAQRAGIRNWDEVLLIDGVTPERSPRLDFRTDDAYLGDDRDPPVHPLLASTVAMARFSVRAAPDSVLTIDVQAEDYSAWQGSQASLDVIDVDGVRVGFVHLWYMHMKDVSGWLDARFDDEWRNVDALVLDARGRGGDGSLASRIADLIGGAGRDARFRGPVVVLQDRQTRSAKEMLVEILKQRGIARLVGEPTAGAVIPSGSVSLGHGMTLLMPVSAVKTELDGLELHPVMPDVPVQWGGPLSGGSDPILQAGLREAKRLVETRGRGAVLPGPAILDGKTKALRPD